MIRKDSFTGSYFSRAIEQASIIARGLKFRKNTPEVAQSHLLNLDDSTARQACLAHFESLERLHQIFEVEGTSRDYRRKFTPNYKQMLTDTYNVDILDSAQEAQPHMWVNGEKYLFSDHIITKGTQMYTSFIELTCSIPCVDSLEKVDELIVCLKKFDAEWCAYEKAYIGELIVIEYDARRFIRALKECSGDEADFLKAVGELNSVANVEGQGRTDFDAIVLYHARKIQSQAVAVKILCSKVKASFRNLLDHCKALEVDFVDPQLRNNEKLRTLLHEFEQVYLQGMEHLVIYQHYEDLTHFSELLSGLQRRNPKFRAMIDSCDAQAFLIIPAIAVLHNMHEIIQRFAPNQAQTASELSKEVRLSGKQALIELDVLESVASGIQIAQKVKACGVSVMRE